MDNSHIVNRRNSIASNIYSTFQDNTLEKGGEGSRGGKVIGYTKSGKPIYDSHNHPEHKNFTTKDHDNAADFHQKSINKIANKLWNKTNGSVSGSGVVRKDSTRDGYEKQIESHKEQLSGHIESKFDKMKDSYHSNKHIIESTLKQEGKHTANTRRLQKENDDIELSFRAKGRKLS